jgi:hypothetical protein
VADLRVRRHSAMQANITFRLELCQPMASALPVGERRHR